METLHWFQAVYRLLEVPTSAAVMAQWQVIPQHVVVIIPDAIVSHRLHRHLHSLRGAALFFADLFAQHQAPFIPAKLSTKPFYLLYGRMKAELGGAFRVQEVVDTWIHIAAHGKTGTGFSCFGTAAMSFLPLLPGMNNVIFYATDPNAILPLPTVNVI